MTTDSASSPPAGAFNPERPAETSTGLPRPIWMIPATLILLWAYAIYRLGMLWHSNSNYSYGWFVPALCLALFWERWKCRPKSSAPHPAGGTFLLLASCGVALAAASLFLEVIPIWRLAGWLFATAIVVITIIAFYFWGSRPWARHFLIPVLFFLIAIPWPTLFEKPLINKLSHLNAVASVHAANLLGTPAVRHGVLIETGPGLVGVDDACSGIRSFQASVMVALFLGELFRYTFSRRLLLLFGGVALAFACNVVRTTYLVCVCDLHGLAAVNLHHDQAGFTILGVTLAGLLAIAWLLRPRRRLSSRSEAQSPDAKAMPPDKNIEDPSDALSGRGAAFAAPALLGAAIWIIIFEVGMESWFRSAEHHAAAAAAWSFQLPAHNLEFSEVKIADNVSAMLKYDEGKAAQWRDLTGRPWQLYYFRWSPAPDRYRAAEAAEQAQGHSPDICLRNAGMILETNLGTQILEFNGVPIRLVTERFNDRGRPMHVASCYWKPKVENGEISPGAASTTRAIRTAWDALRNHDRGLFEQRVIKIGVWDMETDAAAEAALRECLQDSISR